jgi:hypothetical protein
MYDLETSKEEAKSPLKGCEYKPTMGCSAEKKLCKLNILEGTYLLWLAGVLSAAAWHYV